MARRHRVILQPEAASGLEAAYRSMSERGSERAMAWAEGLLQAVLTLEEWPERCPVARESDFFGYTIRHILYGSRPHRHRILFTVVADEVHVLFVRHSAQDWLRPGDEAETGL
jgi:plasmid stabilization system protein ParE